jgi:transcriptional regulator GlxA family with amidase domain
VSEAAAFVIYGIYDLFKGAGRDWGVLTTGQPGPELLRPQVVSSHDGTFAAANGVRITPDLTLDQCIAPQMVSVPEVAIAPGAAIAREVGDEDAGFSTRLFRSPVQLTPAQYRKRFGSMRRALQDASGVGRS